MRAALALWAVAAALAPSSEAANIRRSGGAQLPASATIDAALRARTEVARFGPGNCISTWRNEDGHCEVETRCKDHDISAYPVKFVCIDAGGEKVRHVFSKGSFDSEEQFDTLIECNRCLAEKQEKIEVIAEVAPAAPKDAEELGGAPLKELREEVKSLEGFMRSTSAAIQELNKKVYSDNYKPAKNAAAKAPAPAKPASLVHHTTVHREQRSTVVQSPVVEPIRLKAQALRVNQEHRRHLAEDDDLESPTAKAAKQVKTDDTSMAAAVKASEERDDGAPAEQPARTPMEVAPKASDEDEEDDDGDEESSIPESADEFERQEKESRPSISALQQHKDDDDEDSTVADDESSNTETEDSADATDGGDEESEAAGDEEAAESDEEASE